MGNTPTAPVQPSVITKDMVNEFIISARIHGRGYTRLGGLLSLEHTGLHGFMTYGVTCEYPFVSLKKASPLCDGISWNHVVNQHEFNSRLYAFPPMRPLLEFNFMAHGIVIAGDAVGVHIINASASAVDFVDLYLVGHESNHDRYNAISAFGDHLVLYGPTKVSRTSKFVTFTNDLCSYRISLCAYLYLSELLDSFAAGPQAIAFDGETTWLTRHSMFSYRYSFFPLCLSDRCDGYENIIVNYLRRGFSIIMPHLNVNKIDLIEHIAFVCSSGGFPHVTVLDVYTPERNRYTSIFEDDITSPPLASCNYESGKDLSLVGIDYDWYSSRISEAAALIPSAKVHVYFSDDGNDAITETIGEYVENYVRTHLNEFIAAAAKRVETVKEIGPGLIPYVFNPPGGVVSHAVSEAEWYGDAYVE